MDWLGFKRHGLLDLCDLGSVRIDPLQAGTFSYLCQVLQGQVVGLDFWQACNGRRWSNSFYRRWYGCSRHWCSGHHWRSGCNYRGKRYKFSSMLCPFFGGYRLI